jgi:type II secretory pathway component PulJ
LNVQLAKTGFEIPETMLRFISMSESGSFQQWHSRRSAMTLVELLAATILAALLMAAVLGVLKAVTREQRALRIHPSAEAWQAQLIRQLEWDLANSRSVTSTATGFQLVGFAGRDFASGAALHCRTSIEYAVQNVRGQSFLVRSEAHLDSANLDNQSLELVCNQVERIVLTSSSESTPTIANRTTPPHTDDSSVPDQPVVTLYAIAQEKPVLEHAFVLH